MLLTAYFMVVLRICKEILDRVSLINYNLCFLILSHLPFYCFREIRGGRYDI